MVNFYKTLADYPNQTGINQIAYPLRDAIPLFNPFFAILLGFFALVTISSFYVSASFTGKVRFFNSLVVSSFVTFIVAIFFSLGGLVTPYAVMFFISMTAISFALLIFYK